MDSADASSVLTETDDNNKKEWKQRETWGRTIDFFLACVGFSVGLGNVWRFPYLCYKNGGGAFLIPYFLAVIIGGLPIFYLEIAVGQYMSQGGPKAWSLIPLFQGIGMASSIIAFYVNCYYNVILAWAFYYLFSSFTSELPWERCGHSWNTPLCSDQHNIDVPSAHNITSAVVAAVSGKNTTDPVTEFWENKVLGITSGIEDPGNLKWDLALCLLLAWIIVYGCICKGIKSSGKVMYFTATSPYLFMFILLIRNCTLDGAKDGIEYYLKPNMTKLSEITVWVDAGTQIFFSWTIGMGTTVVCGSYNKFKHNSLREGMIFSAVNSCTSFMSGFIVFSILGFMAKQQNVLVSDVAESGPGLAFIAYPKAVAQLPVSPLWAICFFLMLILLGLDSQFVGVESVITAIVDQYPHVLRRGYRKEIFIGVVCVVMFCVGLPMVTEGGMYVFQIFDFYSGGRILPIVAFTEVIAVSYFYGLNRFLDNIRMMTGKSWALHILPYYKVSWALFSPLFCVTIFLLSMYNYSELSYKRPHHPEYQYPNWCVGFGWSLAVVAFVAVPLMAVYKVVRLVLMGGNLKGGDFKLLLVPYSLLEHQRRPEDAEERCLADFEETRKPEYGMVDRNETSNSNSIC